jgi:hypothetical protein
MLTIATMAFEHLNIGWRRRAFIAYRTADASTSEGSFDHDRKVSYEHSVLPRRPSYTTNVAFATGQ